MRLPSLASMVDILSDLPKPDINTTADIDIKTVTCLCGKISRVEDASVIPSCGRSFIDPRCPSCKKASEKLAIILCVKCKRVVAHMKPMREKRTGFRLDGGKLYHLEECGVCNPSVVANKQPLVTLEKQIYLRKTQK